MAHVPVVDSSLVQLYQSLPVDQCRELYLRQHDNMSYRQRRVLLAVIGSKTVYGEKYTPNYAEVICQK